MRKPDPDLKRIILVPDNTAVFRTRLGKIVVKKGQSSKI
jgi:hypothetical protein